jgi:DNA repair exonuclease SbcCD nuclease subunit
VPSFIHTGDLHLGRPFRRLGSLGKEVRKAQFRCLKNIVDTVKQTRSDFLVVAGDLFDANSVSDKSVKNVMSYFASIAPVPVYIQPGTHDVFDSASVYRTILGSPALPPNVTIIPEEPSEFRPIPDVAVFASANTTKKGGDRPLRRLSALASKSEAKFKVAVVHASIDVPGLSIDPDEPLISLDEIASSPFDYIAMGHWHKRQAWPTGDPKAWYCGTPETLEFDDAPSPGCVNLVSLGPKVTTEEKTVGTYRWVKLGIDVSLVPDMNAIAGRANREAGPNTLLRLELRGSLSSGGRSSPSSGEEGRLSSGGPGRPGVGEEGSPSSGEGDSPGIARENAANFDWAAGLSIDDLVNDLRERLEPNFFFIEVDTSRLAFYEPSPGQFPPNSVGRVFHEIMAEKIEKAQDPAEKAILQEALRRGSLYLSGKAGIRS